MSEGQGWRERNVNNESEPIIGNSFSSGAAGQNKGCMESIHPVVLYGETPTERAGETSLPERTLRRHADAFDEQGMVVFLRPTRKQQHDMHRSLPVPMRQLIVDLKAEHPAFTLREFVARSSMGKWSGTRRHSAVILPWNGACSCCRARFSVLLTTTSSVLGFVVTRTSSRKGCRSCWTSYYAGESALTRGDKYL
jgi:hypothetical protein